MIKREKQSVFHLFFFWLSIILFYYPADAVPPDSFLTDTLFITPDQIKTLSHEELRFLSGQHVVVVSGDSTFPEVQILESDGKRIIVRSNPNGSKQPLYTSESDPDWIPWTLALVVAGTMIAFFTIRF